MLIPLFLMVRRAYFPGEIFRLAGGRSVRGAALPVIEMVPQFGMEWRESLTKFMTTI
jgi:hypothetical protein